MLGAVELSEKRLEEIRLGYELAREYNIIHPGKALDVIGDLQTHIKALAERYKRWEVALTDIANEETTGKYLAADVMIDIARKALEPETDLQR